MGLPDVSAPRVAKTSAARDTSHGGMGYAEEFPVSRYFLDARVLSIFEGADEILALKVIARRLVEEPGAPAQAHPQ
jgi:alkylation response protein AidB-like acyl-CoA dehydrogenase